MMFEKNQTELRADICEVGRRIWQRGYVAYNDGNLSIRLDQERVLATPTGVSKGFLKPDMLVIVDMAGKQIDGHLKMSSEILMHLEMYRERCDVGAVVHTHPPYATGFAVYGQGLEAPTLPEFVVALGGVPLAPYGKPSTPELGETVRPWIQDHDVFLLQNHGALSLGGDIYQAYYRTETLEHSALITFIARCLGRDTPISADEVPYLEQMRENLGLGFPRECLTFQPGSRQPAATGAGRAANGDDAALEALVAKIAERVVRQMRRS
ncbi:MAG: class II aldolase/adducin family protein [Armatimonadetes bacterium]|nr:class II aldolase/adducin family protein [Armatimonadota bacterium]